MHVIYLFLKGLQKDKDKKEAELMKLKKVVDETKSKVRAMTTCART